MNAKQLKKWLTTTGYTQAQLAKALDMSERNIRRYVAGELPIPKVVQMAIQMLAGLT